MALNIIKGKQPRPQKIVIYGPEGIGKTTLASKFAEPLFIDTEGGTSHMEVNRLIVSAGWEVLVGLVNEIADNAGLCKTLVIDTADWAEQACITAVCAKYKKAGIEEFGYGKGYTYVAEEFGRLLAACDRVIASGAHVVITAHAKMRKFEQPDEMGSYDRWEMKLSKQAAPLLKEWADMVLFCNYKTYVVSDENKKAKAQGGKRVIYTSHHPCWDAKNRHGLPEVIDMDYAAIAGALEQVGPVAQPAVKAKPKPEKPAAKPESKKSAVYDLKVLLERDNIREDDLRMIVARKGAYDALTPIQEYSDEFIREWIIPNWDRIVDLIRTNS